MKDKKDTMQRLECATDIALALRHTRGASESVWWYKDLGDSDLQYECLLALLFLSLILQPDPSFYSSVSLEPCYGEKVNFPSFQAS